MKDIIDELKAMDGSSFAAQKMQEAAAEIERLRKGLAAVDALIRESGGVAGLHLNGDIATWDELRTGGRFEGWLVDFDAALTPNVQTKAALAERPRLSAELGGKTEDK